jgi:hypothetical protein
VTPPDQPDPVDRGTDDEQAPEAEATHAPEGVDEVDAQPEPDWVRRRRLDAVFGDGAHGQSLGDRWYRDQVPPHHG